MRIFVASDLEWAVQGHRDGQGPADRPTGLGQQATDQKYQPAQWADEEESFAYFWQERQSEQKSRFKKDRKSKQVVASVPVGPSKEFVRIEPEGSFAKRR